MVVGCMCGMRGCGIVYDVVCRRNAVPTSASFGSLLFAFRSIPQSRKLGKRGARDQRRYVNSAVSSEASLLDRSSFMCRARHEYRCEKHTLLRDDGQRRRRGMQVSPVTQLTITVPWSGPIARSSSRPRSTIPRGESPFRPHPDVGCTPSLQG